MTHSRRNPRASHQANSALRGQNPSSLGARQSQPVFTLMDLAASLHPGPQPLPWASSTKHALKQIRWLAALLSIMFMSIMGMNTNVHMTWASPSSLTSISLTPASHIGLCSALSMNLAHCHLRAFPPVISLQGLLFP